MAKTLSRAEFLALRPGGDYKKYLAYIARVRPKRAARRAQQANVAWMQPLTEQQIRQRSRQEIMAGVNPAIAAIEAAIARRSQAGSSAITGYTRELANALMPFYDSAGAIYDTAAGSQGALASALPAALVGQGQALGGELGSKLNAIDAPHRQVDDVSGGAVRTGAGAGAAQSALSSAEIARLRSGQQADRAYSGAFPGIAGLQGAENTRNLQMALSRELADTLGGITSQVPSQINELVRSYRQEEFDKGIARATQAENRQKLRTESAQAKAERQQANRKLTPASEQINRSTGYIMGYNAAGQLVPFLGPDGKPIKYKPKPSSSSSKGTADKDAKEKAEDAAKAEKDRDDYFYDVRSDVFAQAKTYATPSKSAAGRTVVMSRPEAKRRLMTEYGNLLIGRGYQRKIVVQMIDRALDAAY